MPFIQVTERLDEYPSGQIYNVSHLVNTSSIMEVKPKRGRFSNTSIRFTPYSSLEVVEDYETVCEAIARAAQAPSMVEPAFGPSEAWVDGRE